MPEALTQALLLAGALLSGLLGIAWLALAMEVHWHQVRGEQPLSRGLQRMLRLLGMVALAASLSLCLRADHATMAALVWVMALVASALAVAFTLSWRPRWLAPLLGWSSAFPASAGKR
ncbi:MAG: DUF3325 domain-containing protein [Methylibium sp.]|uniref:DUF3325 domain-containing protein n=1 Tax=Methylibium sp. TaxID=2067992 RepID=UPI0017BA6B2B|nr:DUF3325 domain-containing protein [Methylibium sp.]MBA3597302.1 DUF3325 domain-containing protein [Methylibium sp.]